MLQEFEYNPDNGIPIHLTYFVIQYLNTKSIGYIGYHTLAYRLPIKAFRNEVKILAAYISQDEAKAMVRLSRAALDDEGGEQCQRNLISAW